jgi:hypothetical protein
MTIRTAGEAAAAGLRAAATDPPLTAAQVTAAAVLLAPHQPAGKKTAA